MLHRSLQRLTSKARRSGAPKPAGIREKICLRSEWPASMRSTLTLRSSERRDAMTHPAVPPPLHRHVSKLFAVDESGTYTIT